MQNIFLSKGIHVSIKNLIQVWPLRTSCPYPIQVRTRGYFHVVHVVDRFYLHPDIFQNEIGGRTVGGGEGHVDANVLLIVYLYVIDQAKIVVR
mgnify:CR=1 FL=1